MGQGDHVGDVTVLVAPAKLTVSLRVLGRRPDGYHDLEAEMVSVDLADRLVVDPDGDGLDVVGPVAGVGDGEDNLVRRALSAVGRRAHVTLHKRVPVGGGLGGGSSDAAAILRWAGCRDLSLAARLGADVPFCVDGGHAVVSGIGDRVAPLGFVERSYVLLVPPFGVDTAAVYREWDRQSAQSAQVAQGAATPANDLTAAAMAIEPRLAAWRDVLGESTGRRPVLAGSGSTWWVEGTPAELGVEGRTSLALGAREGRLLAVRTVPAGWAG